MTFIRNNSHKSTLFGIENIQGATKHTASSNPAYETCSVNGVRTVQGPCTFQTIICVGNHTLQHSPHVIDAATTKAYKSKMLTSTNNGSANWLTLATPCSWGLAPDAQIVGARRAGAGPFGILSPRRSLRFSSCVYPTSSTGSGGRPLVLRQDVSRTARSTSSPLSPTRPLVYFLSHIYFIAYLHWQPRFVLLVTL